MNRLAAVLIFLFSSCILVSCLEELGNVDKIQKTTFEPSIDFPLVNSEFNMEEFLTEGESKARITEQGGLMVLTYDDSISTPLGELFFFLPDQQSPVLSITGSEVTFPTSGATVTINKTLSFTFNTASGEVLDSILVKAGQLLFQMTSTFPADINLTVGIPTIQNQGAGFQRDFTFVGPGTQNPTTNLAASVFDLTGNGSTTNTVTFSISAQITDKGQAINSTHRLDFSFALDNLTFRGLFGDLGTRPIPIPSDSINVDVFNNAFGGNVTLLSPSIRLDMKNSFGLPIGFNIQNISAIKENTSVATLSGPALSAPANPYLLAAPSYSQIGQSITSDIEINSGNSNLPQLISSIPQYLAYRFQLALNPAAASKNFVLDTSRLTIGVHLELPFHGRISALTLTKQFDFNGLGIDDPGKSKIKLKTINETPLEMSVQIYFVDTNGTVLDSLFADRSILKGAPVDANAFTQGASEVQMEVPVTQEKINRIEQAELLVIQAIAFTTNSGTVPVKFSSTDKLRISLGINTRVKYNLN